LCAVYFTLLCVAAVRLELFILDAWSSCLAARASIVSCRGATAAAVHVTRALHVVVDCAGWHIVACVCNSQACMVWIVTAPAYDWLAKQGHWVSAWF
jgi:hypothetical protein